MRLTEQAERDRADFMQQHGFGCCYCHTSKPCGHCTHPGNPVNQEMDPECWEATEPQQPMPAEAACGPMYIGEDTCEES